nr:protein NYNRIN-like [Tanacetum cinerariifolium]
MQFQYEGQKVILRDTHQAELVWLTVVIPTASRRLLIPTITKKDKWVVGQDVELRKKLVDHFYNSAIGGHSGVQATTKRLTTYFYWKGLRKMVKEWVRNCDTCQRNKSNLSASPGLLQPLPIPERIWQDISMDFIESLPLSNGNSALLVVVDRMSKFAHFLPITHPYTASQVAQLFLDNVYKLHGLPKTIDCAVEAVDRTLVAREQTLKLLYFNLKKAQDRMKSQADKARSDREFQISDWVYLKLQPYRQLTVRQSEHHKLSSKYFGPFQVIERIGMVAYKLQLPHYVKVHPVFYVFQLKPCYVEAATMGKFSQCDDEGLLAASPLKLLERKIVKQNNMMVIYELIQWSNGDAEDATWEKLEDIVSRFLEFVLDP